MCINKYLPFEQNISIKLTCRAAMFCPAGKGYGVLGFQSPSPVPDTLCLSSIRCAFPQYDVVVSIRRTCHRYVVPVLDTLGLSSIRCAFCQYDVVVLDTPYLSSIRCACPKYAVPVLDTLCLS